MDFTTFFSQIKSSLFNGSLNQGQVDGINVILDKMAEFRGQILRNQAAYILATAYHETGARMMPVRETFASSDAQAMGRLESAWKKGVLTWVKTPYWRDGWYGRGYVQLTHKVNYQKMSDILGLDLVGDRDLTLDEDVAATILIEGMLQGASGKGDFTKYKLEDFVNLKKSDYIGARKVINGNESASKVAGYAKKFEAALEAAGFDTAGELNVGVIADNDAAADNVDIPFIQQQIAELKAMIEDLQKLVPS